MFRMFDGPNKTCLLGKLSAPGVKAQASSSAAEPQKAEESM